MYFTKVMHRGSDICVGAGCSEGKNFVEGS